MMNNYMDQTFLRSNTTNLEDSDAENTVEQDEEPGIISESVSASSVIQMFGGVGRFKKTGSCSTSPSSGKRRKEWNIKNEDN